MNTNENIINQVIGLSMVYAKRNNLPINVDIVTDKNKIPLVEFKSIGVIDVINFSYFITEKITKAKFLRNAMNTWKTLNIYYINMLNIKFELKTSIKYNSIPFVRVENINTMINEEFGISLYSLVDCYNKYLKNFNTIKLAKQRKYDVDYIVSFHYRDISPLINSYRSNGESNEIIKIKQSIRNIDNIIYDNK